MKGRIFTWMLLCAALVCCTSCNNDIPGSDSPIGEDVTLSVAFAVEGVVTKTENPEKLFTNYVILVFDGTGNCIGFSEADTVKAKTGPLKLVGILNPESTESSNLVEQLKAVKKYDELKTLETHQELVASKLIKIGELDTTINTPGKLTGNPIKIMVHQIPARVDITVDAGDNNSFEIKEYEVSGITTASYLLGGKVDNKSWKGFISSLSVVDNKISFYSYEKNTQTNGAIIIDITGDLKKNGIQVGTKKYRLSLNPVQGGASSTNGVVRGYAYDVKGRIKDTGLDVVIIAKSWKSQEVDVGFGGEDSDDSNKLADN